MTFASLDSLMSAYSLSRRVLGVAALHRYSLSSRAVLGIVIRSGMRVDADTPMLTLWVVRRPARELRNRK